MKNPHEPPAGAVAVGPRSSFPLHADDSWHSKHWYEAPREDPAWAEIYVYTDTISYAPGQEVVFHASGTADRWTLEVWRDGVTPLRVHGVADLPGRFTPAPKDAYKAGCGWPVAHRWQLPRDLPSGFYRVVASCLRSNGSRFVQHHFFVVRPAAPKRASLLVLLPTATWMAYNDWGGANHYLGVDGPDGNAQSAVLSLERPWTRGIVWLPEGAPRICAPAGLELGSHPRYAVKEWAYANGFGQYYAASGWAQYDRHFALWAEREGFDLHYITQTDLHYRPELLDGHACVAIVGHDEYWSAEMRQAIDAYVEGGGHVARFAGNFLWQIRLEEEGRRQVCYKYHAKAMDPVRGTADAGRLTTAWEDRALNWPGATTFGVNGLRGMYASWGGFSPHGGKGFTVYRPGHWAFADTGLRYADQLGAEARIFSYEVDGLDYTFRRGLPYPTGSDGAPDGVEILAMAPAGLAEDQLEGEGFKYYIGEGDLRFKAEALSGEVTPETLEEHRYGAGMIVHLPKGKGEVFTAGTCEWVMGLKRGDQATQQVTRNVLRRFLG